MAFKNILVFLSLFLVSAQSSVLYFYGNQHSQQVLTSQIAGSEAVAQAEYSPASEHISNFAQFRVTTNAIYGDDAQTFAAGFLEGISGA